MYGVPVSKCLLWVVLCEIVEQPNVEEQWKNSVQKISDAVQKPKTLTDAEEGIFVPSYPTFSIWLRKLDIKLKSAKSTMKCAYPENIDELGKDMLLRACHYLRNEWNGKVFASLLVNMDETGIAYNCLAERTLSFREQRPGNIALGDKRSATFWGNARWFNAPPFCHLEWQR